MTHHHFIITVVAAAALVATTGFAFQTSSAPESGGETFGETDVDPDFGSVKIQF